MPSGVGVVVVNWNSGDLLGQCLSSLSRQNLPPDKIIVVDNASTDGSTADIEARYRNAKVIQLDTNPGFAEGNNIGVDAAKDCDWIALVNPDAFAEPDWLERIISARSAVLLAAQKTVLHSKSRVLSFDSRGPSHTFARKSFRLGKNHAKLHPWY